MRSKVAYLLLVLPALLWGLDGCNSSDTTGPAPLTDTQALQQQVTTIDSVAQFSVSDEATIDDNGLKSPDYDGVAKEAAYYMRRAGTPFSDSLTPLRWGRHIDWSSVVRDYNVLVYGDTAALVTITKFIPGQFWVGFGAVVNDSVVIDTIVKKPFIDSVSRKVLFARIARTTNPMRNWVPTAITLVHGKSETSNLFSFTSMEIADAARSFDTTITDPLNTWFKLGLFRGSIPKFVLGDSITIRATITSADDSAEVVVLRHSVDVRGSMHRVRMQLISTTGGPGAYTRVYEKKYRANLPNVALASRFNALVDVFSYGSIYSMSDPMMNEYLGSPYIVVR